MSYPKDKCEVVACPYCKMDTQYPASDGVCEYPVDFDEAKTDKSIPEECPWLKGGDSNSYGNPRPRL